MIFGVCLWTLHKWPMTLIEFVFLWISFFFVCIVLCPVAVQIVIGIGFAHAALQGAATTFGQFELRRKCTGPLSMVCFMHKQYKYIIRTHTQLSNQSIDHRSGPSKRKSLKWKQFCKESTTDGFHRFACESWNK